MALSKKRIATLKSNYNELVLITGATSGIGKELAYQLGEAGFDLLITGRRKELLDQIQQEINSQYGVNVTTLPGDLAKKEDVEALQHHLNQYQVGIAILNAGYGTGGELLEMDYSLLENMLDLNCRAVLQLSHFLGNQFKKEGKGALVLLSSLVSFQGTPYMTNYGATKAYVQSLAEGLAYELRPHRVDVLSVTPGPVKTGFENRAGMDFNIGDDSKKVATDIIQAIGKKKVVRPGIMAKFMSTGFKLVPRSLRIKIFHSSMKDAMV
ncbi:SDR family oxidoreductase [Algivirga pacifica]|uniref:NADP-dependent 3-hydroxy acid dehydrogenase YdfG n=1 Tax=Algivirga pacifica TaxID=1162670 RepID=A0ABP9DA64_9BACT